MKSVATTYVLVGIITVLIEIYRHHKAKEFPLPFTIWLIGTIVGLTLWPVWFGAYGYAVCKNLSRRKK